MAALIAALYVGRQAGLDPSDALRLLRRARRAEGRQRRGQLGDRAEALRRILGQALVDHRGEAGGHRRVHRRHRIHRDLEGQLSDGLGLEGRRPDTSS
jgi:hypothetical protein